MIRGKLKRWPLLSRLPQLKTLAGSRCHCWSNVYRYSWSFCSGFIASNSGELNRESSRVNGRQ